MNRELYHTCIISIVLGFSFLISQIIPTEYNLYIYIGLVVAYYLLQKFIRKDHFQIVQASIVSYIVMSFIILTGGLLSWFFFLIYFLLFAISFFLEPVIALTATVTIILLFSLQITNATTLQPFIALGSVGLFTPFAMFMIQQYRQAKNSAHNTSDLRKAVRRDVKAIAYILDQHANTIERAATHFQGDHELDIIKKNAQNLKQVVKQLQNQIEHE